jgi:hypothetical protein
VLLWQPGKHRRSFSSSKAGNNTDTVAAALRAVQSAESSSAAAQAASGFGVTSGTSTEPSALYPILDFEQARIGFGAGWQSLSHGFGMQAVLMCWHLHMKQALCPEPV